MSSNPSWTFEKLAPSAYKLTFDLETLGQRARVLLSSDHHVDNAFCNQRLLRSHLEQARDADIPSLVFGDTFCAMQGRWDKRADQNQLRPELRGNCYLDRLKDYVTEFYRPYASHIPLFTDGNHETSILEHHQTDLVECLCDRLGPQTHHGPYQGWVIISMRLHGRVHSITLCFHHGYGGGGPVSRGLIDFNRTRDIYEADIYYSGHVHRRNLDENIKLTVTNQGQVRRKSELFLRGSTYKEEENCGWQVQRGSGPRPLGGWWLDLRFSQDSNRTRTIQASAEPAI